MKKLINLAAIIVVGCSSLVVEFAAYADEYNDEAPASLQQHADRDNGRARVCGALREKLEGGVRVCTRRNGFGPGCGPLRARKCEC